MNHSSAKSFSCYTTPQRQATPVEMRPSPRSPVHTGGQGCAHGSQTTLRNVQFANKTKTSLIACAPHCTASPPWKMHSHSSRSRWTSSWDYHPMDLTTQC